MICPTCGIDSREPDKPMWFKSMTAVTDDALVNFMRFSCRCGWSMDVNTDDLRTEDDVKRSVALTLRRLERQSTTEDS